MASARPSAQGPSGAPRMQASLSNKSPNPQPNKDYVVFDRSTAAFSSEAVPRAKAAQMKLEHYYKVAVESAIERNTRSVSDVKSAENKH